MDDRLAVSYKLFLHIIQQLQSLVFTQMSWKCLHSKTCTWMFAAALFINAKSWKQPISFSEWTSGHTSRQWNIQFSSVRFSHSVMSNSLRPHESQYTRPPCPSPTPGVHSISRPSSPWCHPAISSCCPLLLLPPIPPGIRVFSNESTLCMRWPKYWSFQL